MGGDICHSSLSTGLPILLSSRSFSKALARSSLPSGVAGRDDEFGVVAPLVGIADLVGDGGELLLGAHLGGGRHPVDLVDVAAHGGLDVVDHLQHFGLAVAGEVLVDVDLAERLAECSVDGAGAALPAGAMLRLAFEDAAVEVEVLVVQGLGQVAMGGGRAVGSAGRP